MVSGSQLGCDSACRRARDVGDQLLQRRPVGQHLAAHALVAHQRRDDVAVLVLPLDDVEDALEAQHLLDDVLQRDTGEPVACALRLQA